MKMLSHMYLRAQQGGNSNNRKLGMSKVFAWKADFSFACQCAQTCCCFREMELLPFHCSPALLTVGCRLDSLLIGYLVEELFL